MKKKYRTGAPFGCINQPSRAQRLGQRRSSGRADESGTVESCIERLATDLSRRLELSGALRGWSQACNAGDPSRYN